LFTGNDFDVGNGKIENFMFPGLKELHNSLSNLCKELQQNPSAWRRLLREMKKLQRKIREENEWLELVKDDLLSKVLKQMKTVRIKWRFNYNKWCFWHHFRTTKIWMKRSFNHRLVDKQINHYYQQCWKCYHIYQTL